MNQLVTITMNEICSDPRYTRRIEETNWPKGTLNALLQSVGESDGIGCGVYLANLLEFVPVHESRGGYHLGKKYSDGKVLRIPKLGVTAAAGIIELFEEMGLALCTTITDKPIDKEPPQKASEFQKKLAAARKEHYAKLDALEKLAAPEQITEGLDWAMLAWKLGQQDVRYQERVKAAIPAKQAGELLLIKLLDPEIDIRSIKTKFPALSVSEVRVRAILKEAANEMRQTLAYNATRRFAVNAPRPS